MKAENTKGDKEFLDEIMKITGFSKEQVWEIRIGYNHWLPEEKLKIYAKPEYNADQMCAIRVGLENGLPAERVKVYADPRLGYHQMRQCYLGLMNPKLSASEVAIYAKPEFDAAQMNVIRFGLEQGLTADEVRVFANPKLTFLQMRECCIGFVHELTEKQVESYASPELLVSEMEAERLKIEARNEAAKLRKRSDYSVQRG